MDKNDIIEVAEALYKELEIYFKNWLYRLGISEEFYQKMKKELC